MNYRIKQLSIDIFNAAVDAVCPPACPMCGEPLGFANGKRLKICERCRFAITYLTEPLCLKCGKRIENGQEEYCADCAKHKHYYDRCVAVYEYSDVIKNAIYRFKYYNKREYAKTFATEIQERCKDMIALWQPDVIIPVPISDKKFRKRGYNQAELIAGELSELTGIMLDSKALLRIRDTKPMKELSNEERMKNLKNAFISSKNVVKYRKVLIVDDIYTTGATFDECSRTLKENGVLEVYGISLCIGAGF